jgi:hypothetical protein
VVNVVSCSVEDMCTCIDNSCVCELGNIDVNYRHCLQVVVQSMFGLYTEDICTPLIDKLYL